MKRRRTFVPLLFLALFLSLAPAALAHIVWYVDGVHGDDNNNCKSPKTACKTMGHAISLASPGNVVLVGAAIYTENLTIKFSLGIIGSGSRRTIIDGQSLDTVVFIPDDNAHVVLAGLTIRNGSATYNTGGCGGGIANWGTLTGFDIDVNRNTAGDRDGDDGTGAGICNAGTLTLSHSTVSENETIISYFSWGAGIFNDGAMIVNDSTVRGNTSETTDEFGGGIYNGGALTVNRSTINGNSTSDAALAEGGGLYNAGEATLNNSTLYGNTSKGGDGGGIANSGAITINNSTINGNSADYGGGGIRSFGTVTLQNSIVADNGDNCSGSVTSNGYNLSSDNTCNFNGPGDLNNSDPKLGPLRNNGGPTQTMAELPGGPTVDAGNPEGCTDSQGHRLKTDQRGFPRPGRFKHKHRCDMGAFERQKD